MVEFMDKMETLAKEVGALEEKEKDKFLELNI